MNYAELKAEIESDPLNRGYAALVTAGRDADIAASLNAKDYTANSYVPISAIESYVDSHSLRDGIEEAVSTNPAARAASRLFLARYETVDTTNTAVATVLGGLVLSGLLTQGDANAIAAMGTVPASRAEVLFGTGVVVNHQDVSTAIRS